MKRSRIEVLTIAAHKLRPIDSALSDELQALALTHPCDAFLAYLVRRSDADSELIRRLAGSVRKAATMR